MSGSAGSGASVGMNSRCMRVAVVSLPTRDRRPTLGDIPAPRSTAPLLHHQPGAGLLPMIALAQQCDLPALADEHLSVPTDKGANAGAKVTSLVRGHGRRSRQHRGHGVAATRGDGHPVRPPYAPSTLASFLRESTFGHVRQLDAVAARLVTGLHDRTPLLAGIDGPVLVDIDDTIMEVHGRMILIGDRRWRSRTEKSIATTTFRASASTVGIVATPAVSILRCPGFVEVVSMQQHPSTT